ncbi:putative protein [Arabidopsis thaliana]|nr:putative protein [Arabidopsis thaliana]
MTEIFSDTGFRQLTQMFLAIIFFHTSEYILAIAIHGASKVTLSSLLISKHYALAMLISVLEYIAEIVFFPGLKQHWWISNFGLTMIILGEILRKTAIITAEGVYQIMRHPSYSGFLIWSVGTQVMLCNPISAIAFAVVVWRFFAERIPYEEHYLKQFFGRQYVEYAQRVPSGLGFCGAKIVQLSSFFLRPSQAMAKSHHFSRKLRQRMISSFGSHCRTSGEVPILHNCFSQREDDPELPVEGLSPVSGGIVALGKFDALHIGHRELTIQASRIGAPYLLSFVGMAEVLGWEPRAPIVAKCDRQRVLTSWASYCGDRAPEEYEIEFASVRHLTPRQFVEKLSKELRVCGVVAASGDASELVRLCEECGITACIINSVMDMKQGSAKRDSGDSKDRGQVSSTRVRQALAAGDMRYVSELLGRAHRLILRVRTQDMPSERMISVPRSSILNLPPGIGIYKACLLLVGDESSVPCTVVVDTSNIHVETEEETLGGNSKLTWVISWLDSGNDN